jgi:hypothetical protein
MLRQFYWFLLCICGMMSIGILVFVINIFKYREMPEISEFVSLAVGLMALSAGHTIYKHYLKKPGTEKAEKPILEKRYITLFYGFSWTLFIFAISPLVLMTGLVIVIANDDLPVLMAMSTLTVSTLAYLAWRYAVLRKKYGVNGGISVNFSQLFSDFFGENFFYLWIVTTVAISISAIFLFL